MLEKLLKRNNCSCLYEEKIIYFVSVVTVKSDFTGTTSEKKKKTIASIVAEKKYFATASIEVKHFTTVTRNKNDTAAVNVRK